MSIYPFFYGNLKPVDLHFLFRYFANHFNRTTFSAKFALQYNVFASFLWYKPLEAMEILPSIICNPRVSALLTYYRKQMKHQIYIRHHKKIFVAQGLANTDGVLVATILKNIENLGFTFTAELIERLKTLDEKQLEGFYLEIIAELKEMVGDHVQHKPMYPNFPKQVMKMSEAELYINAIIHYITGGLPQYDKIERFPLIDNPYLRILDLGTKEEFEQVFTNLVGAKSSISITEKEDLEWFFAEYGDQTQRLLPTEIVHKENMALACALAFKYTEYGPAFAEKHLDTATDILRFYTALSEWDVSLATNTKFKSIPRSQRKFILKLLERKGNIAEDMNRYPEKWKRAGEYLHPREFSEKFLKVAEAFDVVRNNKIINSFYHKVELALENDIPTAIELLKQRPGELVRKLDVLLRRATEPQQVIEAAFEVIDSVSTPVLIQAHAHFKYRDEIGDLRTFFPKGDVGRAYAVENELVDIAPKVLDKVISVIETALIKRFAELERLGKVYIDPQLTNYPTPLQERSASKSLITLPRGSVLELDKGSTIRFFLYWSEGEIDGKETGRVDIDLSAVMYDSDWNYIEHISYTNLKSDKYKAAHSGDITSAPNGASEFIDLDIASILKFGGRYVVASVNSFTNHPYCNLPMCFAGWMLRSKPNSGEIYEPKTVKNKFDLAADTRICLPVIIDLLDRKVHWIDLALTKQPTWANNIEANLTGMTLMGKSLTTMIRPNLFDLFSLHATARGELVQDPAQADTIFSLEEGIRPTDISRIRAEYLS